MSYSTNQQIRLLQLGSPTGLYGAERWILALIKHMDKRRFDVHVAAFQDDPSLKVPLCSEAAKLGFKTHVFKVPGRFNPSAVLRLREFIISRDIHILHTHAYKQDIIGFLACLGATCKIVTTPHGWSKEPDMKLRCYEMLNRAVFPFFDAVVPLSQDLYDPLASSIWYSILCKLTNKRFNELTTRQLPDSTNSRIPYSTNQRINDLTNKRIPKSTNLHLIENGVDISEIDSVNETVAEINVLRKQGKFIIGFIGQLIHRKGLDILLRAVAQLPRNINSHLLIIGEGNQSKELQDLVLKLNIKDRVEFLGFRADRLKLLKGFDVFVLPSRLEGIPRCLMEAMAAKVAVVASDISGCNDLIEDELSGFLFRSEDIRELAATIQKVIFIERDKLETMKMRARKLIENRFSARRMALEYEKLFTELCR